MRSPLARISGLIFVIVGMVLLVLMLGVLSGTFLAGPLGLLVAPLPVLLGLGALVTRHQYHLPAYVSVALPLVILWSGWTYWRVGWGRVLRRAAAGLQFLGVVAYAYGVWQGNADCHSGRPDGLCFLIGALISMCGLAVFGLGTLSLVADSMTRRSRAASR